MVASRRNRASSTKDTPAAAPSSTGRATRSSSRGRGGGGDTAAGATPSCARTASPAGEASPRGRSEAPAVGTRVSCWWKADAQWYRGRVTARKGRGAAVDVAYNDGDAQQDLAWGAVHPDNNALRVLTAEWDGDGFQREGGVRDYTRCVLSDGGAIELGDCVTLFTKGPKPKHYAEVAQVQRLYAEPSHGASERGKTLGVGRLLLSPHERDAPTRDGDGNKLQGNEVFVTDILVDFDVIEHVDGLCTVGWFQPPGKDFEYVCSHSLRQVQNKRRVARARYETPGDARAFFQELLQNGEVEVARAAGVTAAASKSTFRRESAAKGNAGPSKRAARNASPEPAESTSASEEDDDFLLSPRKVARIGGAGTSARQTRRNAAGTTAGHALAPEQQGKRAEEPAEEHAEEPEQEPEEEPEPEQEPAEEHAEEPEQEADEEPEQEPEEEPEPEPVQEPAEELEQEPEQEPVQEPTGTGVMPPEPVQEAPTRLPVIPREPAPEAPTRMPVIPRDPVPEAPSRMPVIPREPAPEASPRLSVIPREQVQEPAEVPGSADARGYLPEKYRTAWAAKEPQENLTLNWRPKRARESDLPPDRERYVPRHRADGEAARARPTHDSGSSAKDALKRLADQYRFVPGGRLLGKFYSPEALVSVRIDQDPRYEQASRLQRFQRGFVFRCNQHTHEECMRLQLFGSQEEKWPLVRSIDGRTAIFLLNSQSNTIEGVFEMASEPRLHIDPRAFGGRFGAQVLVRPVSGCLFRPLGVTGSMRGSPELDAVQFQRLLNEMVANSHLQRGSIECALFA